MKRVLIADDHAVVREGLKLIIAATPDLTVGSEAIDASEVMRQVRLGELDIVLLDITFPGANGLDLLKRIKAECPGLPVLILSMHPEEHYAVRALRAGASGYVTKESAPDQLVCALRKVSQGGKYVSQALAEKLGVEIGRESVQPAHRSLSDREFQVLCLIASGKTVTEISEDLALSVKTVSTYRSRLLEKMGMNTNAELTHYAIRNALVD